MSFERAEKKASTLNHDIIAANVQADDRVAAHEPLQEISKTSITQVVLAEVYMCKRVHINPALLSILQRLLHGNDLAEDCGSFWAQTCFIQLNTSIFDRFGTVLDEAELLLAIIV